MQTEKGSPAHRAMPGTVPGDIIPRAMPMPLARCWAGWQRFAAHSILPWALRQAQGAHPTLPPSLSVTSGSPPGSGPPPSPRGAGGGQGDIALRQRGAMLTSPWPFPSIPAARNGERVVRTGPFPSLSTAASRQQHISLLKSEPPGKTPCSCQAPFHKHFLFGMYKPTTRCILGCDAVPGVAEAERTHTCMVGWCV